MEHPPTPERHSAEPEIIPPNRREARSRDGASQVWISFNRQGGGRTYTMSPGTPGIMVALLFGVLMLAIFVVVFATLLVWIVVAGAVIALFVLAALLLRRIRGYRR
jgi:Flp pilus assembly protein TadB